ncbi:MAG: bifunctional hydroxymethylpyrimidine kinase/phosphomethylpyrimidine kinase [Burkholderiaceae bacterium]|nr:bifunctional hydroxymethylpyrimidine kinase/phosphomethylpyrimidine kinase [Burkholderiaceae bacterium]
MDDRDKHQRKDISGGPAARFRYARVLTIAGSDSGGGAGIQADLKTFAALGCYGMSAITALTAQNTCGVHGIRAVPAAFVRAQIDAVVSDLGVDAVKLGMLHSPQIVRGVARAIDAYRLTQVVLDPVMVATSGDRLMSAPAVQTLVRELFPRVLLVTPNLDEAAHLVGHPIESVDAFESAALELLDLGARAVLLKGGHLKGGHPGGGRSGRGAQARDRHRGRDEVVDLLVQRDAAPLRLASPRIASRNLHGTGCTLSAAIAAHLALGAGLPEAVTQARHYVTGAIAAGAPVSAGAGSGPLNHGYAPVPMQRIGRLAPCSPSPSAPRTPHAKIVNRF